MPNPHPSIEVSLLHEQGGLPVAFFEVKVFVIEEYCFQSMFA
jgi:hypothetical protein